MVNSLPVFLWAKYWKKSVRKMCTLRAVMPWIPNGRAGVLFGHDGGGTIARVMGVQKEKGFSVILAVGLEKLIPGKHA